MRICLVLITTLCIEDIQIINFSNYYITAFRIYLIILETFIQSQKLSFYTNPHTVHAIRFIFTAWHVPTIS